MSDTSDVVPPSEVSVSTSDISSLDLGSALLPVDNAQSASASTPIVNPHLPARDLERHAEAQAIAYRSFAFRLLGELQLGIENGDINLTEEENDQARLQLDELMFVADDLIQRVRTSAASDWTRAQYFELVIPKFSETMVIAAEVLSTWSQDLIGHLSTHAVNASNNVMATLTYDLERANLNSGIKYEERDGQFFMITRNQDGTSNEFPVAFMTADQLFDDVSDWDDEDSMSQAAEEARLEVMNSPLVVSLRDLHQSFSQSAQYITTALAQYGTSGVMPDGETRNKYQQTTSLLAPAEEATTAVAAQIDAEDLDLDALIVAGKRAGQVS